MIDKKNKKIYKFEDYEIKIRYIDKYFFLKIDELSLIVKSTNLEKGFIQIKNKYLELVSIFQDSQQELNLPQPIQEVKNNYILNELKIFMYKFIILGIIFVFVSFFITSFIALKARQVSIVDLLKSEVRTVISTINEKLPKSEEEKKKQIENFSNFINEIKPYLNELNSIN